MRLEDNLHAHDVFEWISVQKQNKQREEKWDIIQKRLLTSPEKIARELVNLTTDRVLLTYIARKWYDVQ